MALPGPVAALPRTLRGVEEEAVLQGSLGRSHPGGSAWQASPGFPWGLSVLAGSQGSLAPKRSKTRTVYRAKAVATVITEELYQSTKGRAFCASSGGSGSGGRRGDPAPPPLFPPVAKARWGPMRDPQTDSESQPFA